MSDLELTMMRRVGELKAEVERLNAVIESHKDAGLRILAMLDEERRLSKHLKSEVERLDTLCKQLMAQHSDISCENIMLRKAGDAMQDDLKIQVWPWASQFKSIKHWNAAKEGKGQP
jgi:archaellum component FlaC